MVSRSHHDNSDTGYRLLFRHREMVADWLTSPPTWGGEITPLAQQAGAVQNCPYAVRREPLYVLGDQGRYSDEELASREHNLVVALFRLEKGWPPTTLLDVLRLLADCEGHREIAAHWFVV